MKLLAAAAGLALVASSPVLTAALVPAVALIVAAEVAYVACRVRRVGRRSPHHILGAC